jgi:hypothetical protein
MLDLTDAKWHALNGNYGNGEQIAELLSKANANAPMDQWYEDLFQGLCHQDTVSEAAYAAAPHLVKLAASSKAIRLHLLILLGACYANSASPVATELEEEWHPAAKKPIPISAELEEEWQASARMAIPLLAELLSTPQPELELRHLFASLAAFHGYQWLAKRLETLDVEGGG